MRLVVLSSIAVCTLAVPHVLHAQGSRAVQAGALDAAAVHQVVDSIAILVEAEYAVPDTGKLIAAYLRERLRTGAYTRIQDRPRLADALSADMQHVNGDVHLYVRPSAGGAQAAGPRMIMVMPGTIPPGVERTGSAAPFVIVQPRDSNPVRSVSDVPGASQRARGAAERDNFHIDHADRLAGNVGYVSFSLVAADGGEGAFHAFDAAMAFLEHTDAMIIDLRDTRGGEPTMSDYVSSYFLPDSTPTLTSCCLGSTQPVDRRAHAVGGQKRLHIPVFVLVGPGTASGGEDLAFALKQTGRATLVGERTAGAGRLNRIFPVGQGFDVSVSVGRTFDPRTKAEWERVGVQPDIRVPADDAVVTAHAEALDRLARTAADATQQRTLRWTREILLARAASPRAPARALAECVGMYGMREVSMQNGRLLYRARPGGPTAELIPLGENTYGLGESTKIVFERVGPAVAAMEVVSPDGQVSTFPRIGGPSQSSPK